MKVLRVYHSGVVDSWRERDRQLRMRGHDIELISPKSWNEGGATVTIDKGSDQFVTVAPTIGKHPYLFCYDPRPIWRALRSGVVDVLDVHEEPASLAALELLSLRFLARSKAPVLFYGAQNIEKRFPVPFRWFERLALRTAAGTYCCNAEAGEIFRRKGFSGDVRIIGLGIDVDRFSPPSVAPSSPPFRLGYVGRLEWRKGIPVVIEALQSVNPDVEFHLFGTGPDEQRLRDLVEARGLTGRVVFHGFTPHADLPEVYRSLHTVVVPSQTTPSWVEQFGRVVVEAMASGTPVIGSDSGSIPEVIGQAGIVVPEADVAQWAEAITRLASAPDLRRSIAEAGLAAVRRYSWPEIAAAHAALYEAVAG